MNEIAYMKPCQVFTVNLSIAIRSYFAKLDFVADILASDIVQFIRREIEVSAEIGV